ITVECRVLSRLRYGVRESTDSGFSLQTRRSCRVYVFLAEFVPYHNAPKSGGMDATERAHGDRNDYRHHEKSRTSRIRIGLALSVVAGALARDGDHRAHEKHVL